MKNNSAIIFGVITVILLAVFLIMNYGSRKRANNWYEQYHEKSKDPYALFLAERLLQNYFPDKGYTQVQGDFMHTLAREKSKDGNYVFLGEQFYISAEGTDTLLQFIEKGNNAFIATKKLPYHLLFRLFQGEQYCQENDYTGEELIFSYAVSLNLLHPNLALENGVKVNFKGEYEGKKIYHRWNYIPTKYLCEKGFQPVGTIDKDYINFAYIPYGKGRIYLHTNPEVFTNYFLKKDAGKTYFDGVLAHLKNDFIYYDVSARKQTAQNRNQRQARNNNEGPLSYILSQRSLAYSWYTLIAMGLLFLIFRSKRKQRIIPIMDKNENTSLVFIQNISHLYFQQGNNKQLAQQKFSYFLEFVLTKYNLTLRDENAFKQKLVQKSGIDESKIKEILTLNNNIEATIFLSDTTMTKFALTINHFYKNCK